jgi:hypothetical protein
MRTLDPQPVQVDVSHGNASAVFEVPHKLQVKVIIKLGRHRTE